MDLNPLDCRCQCTSYCISSEPVNRICTVHVKVSFFRYIISLVQLNNFSTGNRSCFINYNVACCLQVKYAGMRLTHTQPHPWTQIVQVHGWNSPGTSFLFSFLLLFSVVCCCFCLGINGISVAYLQYFIVDFDCLYVLQVKNPLADTLTSQ